MKSLSEQYDHKPSLSHRLLFLLFASLCLIAVNNLSYYNIPSCCLMFNECHVFTGCRKQSVAKIVTVLLQLSGKKYRCSACVSKHKLYVDTKQILVTQFVLQYQAATYC